jgi:hypothetical protein
MSSGAREWHMSSGGLHIEATPREDMSGPCAQAPAAQAFLGGSASLKTLAQVEPTCFRIGPEVYVSP